MQTAAKAWSKITVPINTYIILNTAQGHVSMWICSVQLDEPFAKNRWNAQWSGAEDAIGDAPDMWHWTTLNTSWEASGSS